MTRTLCDRLAEIERHGLAVVEPAHGLALERRLKAPRLGMTVIDRGRGL